ncbi:unnamed protein product [Sphagnum jensenii]|uniref:Nucleotide-diphospho-sugar transferase domain-containing protein n=1 Tax=Sphagnum jensenii TaxID=128206 RepID=A0ABP1BGE2_9BRYO
MWFQYPQLQTAPQTHIFGSQLRASRNGLFNLTSCRPHLLAILQLGYVVLYNDVDLAWLADPFPLFEGHRDIFLSDDLAVVKPETHSHEQPPPGEKGCAHLCSCMLFLRLAEGATLLLHLWIKELQGQPWTFHDRGNDQPGFTRALNKTASQVDVYLLPQVAFSPGGLYFTIDS